MEGIKLAQKGTRSIVGIFSFSISIVSLCVSLIVAGYVIYIEDFNFNINTIVGIGISVLVLGLFLGWINGLAKKVEITDNDIAEFKLTIEKIKSDLQKVLLKEIKEISVKIDEFGKRFDLKVENVQRTVVDMGLLPSNEIDHLINLETNEILENGNKILTKEVHQLFIKEIKKGKINSSELAISIFNHIPNNKLRKTMINHKISNPASILKLFDIYAQQLLKNKVEK